MYGDNVINSTGNEICTWDVKIMIIVLFKSFVTWYNGMLDRRLDAYVITGRV